MRQLLLFIQSQDHVDALANAAPVIKSENYEGIWVLFSPAVLVDTKSAASAFDKNIADLTAAKDRCKAADDFDGARAYKTQLDAALLERNAKVRDSWKAMSPADQEAATVRVLGSFLDQFPADKLRAERMHDHYEPGQFIDALNAHRKAWFVPFTPGNFTFAWPTSFQVAKQAAPAALPVSSAPNSIAGAALSVASAALSQPQAAEPKKPGGNPMFTSPRYRELSRLTVNQLGEIMLKHGLNLSGTAAKIAAGIWKHEQNAKAA